MLDPIRQTILYDQNAIYYGYPIEKLMEKAGEGIAKALVKKYGKGKRIGFFCGPGNNGGDGFAAARYLEKIASPEVYLITDAKNINTLESRKNWKLWHGEKKDEVHASDIPNHFDIVVECLFGTGVRGPLREPYRSVVKKLNQLKGNKVTIDLPTPGFRADFVISMMFAKVGGAVAVDIGYPDWLAEKIGIGEVKVLHKPDEKSHKGQNGRLLIIGGSEQFHGAPLFAAKIASKIVDLVYFSSTLENNTLVKSMKTKLYDFIAMSQKNMLSIVPKVDTVLIGPGLGRSTETEEVVNTILKKFPHKKTVLDAGALNVLDPKNLHDQCILTPHKQEFRKVFGVSTTKETVKKQAKKHQCTIVLKGKVDFVADREQLKINATGNAGMTKGGTGDVLAGLIAALTCTNEPFLAASSGVFINGLAADRLKERVSYHYSASDLIREIPRTIKWCEDF